MNKIASRIYELLEQSGMSKKDFSEKIGVSRNTIQNWKKLDSMPTLAVITTICEVFHITIEQFFCGMGNEENEQRELAFLDSWRMLSDNEKVLIEQILKTFRDIRTTKHDKRA